jgi:GTP cyclohydrolase I
MIYIGFPEGLFSEEARANTQRRIEEMLQEFKEWQDWDDLERGKGIFPSSSGDLIIEKEIPFTSFCEHHLMPFQGRAAIAYIPRGYIVGLSKLARTVRKFASRPQLQEQMTHDVADYLCRWIPNVEDVMVYIEAEHMCMEARGARMHGKTVTSAVRGKFLNNPSLRAETMELIK